MVSGLLLILCSTGRSILVPCGYVFGFDFATISAQFSGLFQVAFGCGGLYRFGEFIPHLTDLFVGGTIDFQLSLRTGQTFHCNRRSRCWGAGFRTIAASSQKQRERRCG
ncbi:hypothetical protein BSQ44_08430 [Aquibium oceanicum]|uniref:Uncharacterized protein n=1 Tax=Aquibium oceanicum TaxID=1670800 RepID=A0A1L3SPQ2_9HYPH|nr:hypothetical protein BSQ44_08430 [Aquibium oceanicum]